MWIESNIRLMRILIIALLVCAALSEYSESEMLVTKAFEEQLRKIVDWEVESYENNIFRGWTFDDYKNYFGNSENGYLIMADDSIEAPLNKNLDLPEHFDAREKWPKCIHPIRVQGRCGSCWAFGTTEALSDRFCINGKDVILSPQDLVSCDRTNHGCAGGAIIAAYQYLEAHGAYSEACFPYTSGGGSTPPCPSGCTAHGQQPIKHHCAQGSIHGTANIEQMKEFLFNHGPLTTSFTHYEDFTYYKGGIYEHKSGRVVGGHVMKTVGWGEEKGVNYWIIANTYGTEWGEHGYVRFKMHDCGIDNAMTGCHPKL